jgi:hypothetical protein
LKARIIATLLGGAAYVSTAVWAWDAGTVGGAGAASPATEQVLEEAGIDRRALGSVCGKTLVDYAKNRTAAMAARGFPSAARFAAEAESYADSYWRLGCSPGGYLTARVAADEDASDLRAGAGMGRR